MTAELFHWNKFLYTYIKIQYVLTVKCTSCLLQLNSINQILNAKPNRDYQMYFEVFRRKILTKKYYKKKLSQWPEDLMKSQKKHYLLNLLLNQKLIIVKTKFFIKTIIKKSMGE